MIELHPQLEKDCFIVGKLRLCSLLLLNDANYPWFILLPNRENISEIHQLAASDQQQLMKESMILSHCIEEVFHPDKLNIAALGNIVPQLHIHHIARFTTDASWPAPVWGAVSSIPYQKQQIEQIKDLVINWFTDNAGQALQSVDQTSVTGQTGN